MSVVSDSSVEPSDLFFQLPPDLSNSSLQSKGEKCNEKEVRIKQTRRVHHHAYKTRLAQVMPLRLPAECGVGEFVVVQIEQVDVVSLRLSSDRMCASGFVVLLLRRDLYEAVEKARANDEPVSKDVLASFDSSCACGALLTYELTAGSEPLSTQLKEPLYVFKEPRAAVRSFRVLTGFQFDSDLTPSPPPSSLSLMDMDQASASSLSPAGAYTSQPHQLSGLLLHTLDGQLQLFDWDSLSVSATYAPASPVLGFDISSSPVDKVLVLTADRQIHHLSLLRAPKTNLIEQPNAFDLRHGQLPAASFTATRDSTDLDERMFLYILIRSCRAHSFKLQSTSFKYIHC